MSDAIRVVAAIQQVCYIAWLKTEEAHCRPEASLGCSRGNLDLEVESKKLRGL